MAASKGRKRNALCFAVLIILGFGILEAATWASTRSVTQAKPMTRWDPRKAPADAQFVGDQICSQCHKKQVAPYSESAMGMAMEAVTDSRVLAANPDLVFRNGPYSYAIKRKDRQSFYRVTDGKETLTVPILYAFGQGKAGQTYVLRYEGELYESLVSFYKGVGGLDFTVGASSKVPSSLKEALGWPLSEDETKNCFGCHSTGSVSGGRINLERVVPGVRCETCHGPGGQHVAAIQSGEPGGHLIFNPKRLSGDELSQEFCSACHRSNGDFEKLRSLQVNNVRFQPYRIFYSKCYSDDRRISCTACHNPHEPVKEDVAYYDAKCLACHTAQSKAQDRANSTGQGSAIRCKVGTKECVSCHMQKVGPPQAHFKFTDHYIRIIKSGEAYPN